MYMLNSKLLFINGEYGHWCIGCGTLHKINTFKPTPATGFLYKFDGNLDSPSFTPSIVFRDKNTKICQYTLTNGKVSYLGNCTHSFASMTIDLPDIPQWYLDTFEN